jgi:FMN phosphatase YigB (HAD superfamily)
MIASRIELVIFDCDGVLVDSEPIINQARAHLLTACGFVVPPHRRALGGAWSESRRQPCTPRSHCLFLASRLPGTRAA